MGHGSRVQVVFSVTSPVHDLPPLLATSAGTRLRDVSPAPQVTEHTSQDSQLFQRQSTGHACDEQFVASCGPPVHWFPPVHGLATVRLRTICPPPQDFEQTVQAPQADQSQSADEQFRVLHASVSLRPATQGLPQFCEVWLIFRDREMTPPPHRAVQ